MGVVRNVDFRVWEAFKTLDQMRLNLKNRTCWSKCWDCKKSWNDTNTVFVNMANFNKAGKETTVFICDSCIQERKDKRECIIVNIF